MDELENLCFPVGRYLEDYYELITSKNQVKSDQSRRRKSASDLLQKMRDRLKIEESEELLLFAKNEAWKNVSQCKLHRMRSYLPSFPLFTARRVMDPGLVFDDLMDRRVFALCANSTYDNMIIQRGAKLCGKIRPFSGEEVACWLGLNLIAAQSSQKSLEIIRKMLTSEDPKLSLTMRRYDMIDKYFTVDVKECWGLMNTKFRVHWQSGDTYCLDENICPFRGRFSAKVNLPRKPKSEGILHYVVTTFATQKEDL